MIKRYIMIEFLISVFEEIFFSVAEKKIKNIWQ